MNETTTRVAIVGARGRLGARIAALIETRDDVVVTACISRETRDPDGDVDVVIDVSAADGASRAIALAETLGAPLLQASTGLAARDVSATDALAGRVPVLVAPNLAPGVALLGAMLTIGIERLPSGWTVDVHESHHAGKKDAPSGTARMIAETARRAGHDVPDERIHATREGDIVGQHEIVLSGPLETIRIRHDAEGRDLFAIGAINAARWLHGRSPGRYTMADILAG